MQLLVTLLVAIAIAIGTGLGSAWLIVGEGLVMKSVQSGQWSAWPGSGQPHPDPYSRAVIARTGQAPLGAGEGVVFYASRDDQGFPLRGGCDYALTGTVPDARLWTLQVVDAGGNVMKTQLGRTSFTSRDVVRMGATHQIEIALSPRARPGNWLPIGASGQLTAILRLYDPQGGTPLADMVLPKISPRGCA